MHRIQVTSQSLAVSFGPILMCHSKFEELSHIPKPIEILKYLIDLWPPKPQTQQSKAPVSAPQQPTQDGPGGHPHSSKKYQSHTESLNTTKSGKITHISTCTSCYFIVPYILGP